MTFTLDGNTLPAPQGFTREQIETGSKHTSVNGTTRKQVTNRKERYIVEYRRLTQAQASAILTIWNQEDTVSFSVSGEITISSTTVHVEIQRREYNTPGGEVREDITLILEEEV